jgi:hypothetical protein
MAHYALIDNTNTVVQVITGVDENIIQTDLDGTQVGGSSEAWEQFYASLPWFEGLRCKRTSYNTIANTHTEGETPFRGNFAGIGYKYNQDFDVFIPPQPYPSWELNYTTYLWEAPIAKPDKVEGYDWKWSEYNKEWVQVAIPSA